MTTAQIEALLDALFTNGFGEPAARLMLVDANNRDLGGWCRKAVRDRIVKYLGPENHDG